MRCGKALTVGFGCPQPIDRSQQACCCGSSLSTSGCKLHALSIESVDGPLQGQDRSRSRQHRRSEVEDAGQPPSLTSFVHQQCNVCTGKRCKETLIDEKPEDAFLSWAERQKALISEHSFVFHRSYAATRYADHVVHANEMLRMQWRRCSRSWRSFSARLSKSWTSTRLAFDTMPHPFLPMNLHSLLVAHCCLQDKLQEPGDRTVAANEDQTASPLAEAAGWQKYQKHDQNQVTLRLQVQQLKCGCLQQGLLPLWPCPASARQCLLPQVWAEERPGSFHILSGKSGQHSIAAVYKSVLATYTCLQDEYDDDPQGDKRIDQTMWQCRCMPLCQMRCQANATHPAKS